MRHRTYGGVRGRRREPSPTRFFRGSRAAKKDFLCVALIFNFAFSSETGIDWQ